MNSFSKRLDQLRKLHCSTQYQQWTSFKYSQKKRQYILVQLLVVVIFSISVIQQEVQKQKPYETITIWKALVHFIVQIIFISLVILLTRYEISLGIRNNLFQILVIAGLSGTLWLFFEQQSQVLAGIQIIWIQMFISQLRYKFLSVGVFSGFLFYYEAKYAEDSMITLIVITVVIINELNQVFDYYRYMSLVQIIEQIPIAMGIVEKDKSQIIYSNSQFEKLAVALNQSNSKQFLNDSKYLERIQLNLLQSLNLKELRHEGFQISDVLAQIDDEGITDEQYKIKKVFFGKNRSVSTRDFLSESRHLVNQQQYINYKDELKSLLLERQAKQVKAYTSDITLELELQHYPTNYIQSALKKKRKRSEQVQSNKQSRDSPQLYQLSTPQSKFPPSRGSAEQDQQFLIDQFEPLPPIASQANISIVQHKMKFMVHLMDNCDFMGCENLQIYYLNELSPFILQTKVKKLEQVKKNLLRSISHELVTYLNGAYGYLYQAQQVKSDNPQLQLYVNMALKYINLQIHKIQDFFDFKDILNDNFTLKMEQFDLVNLLQESIELLQEHCKQKLLQMKLVIDPSLQSQIMINCDKQRLFQVVLNLIANSIRFTFQGEINISVKPAITYFDCEQSKNIVEVRVKDTGLGLEEEQLGILMKKLLSVDDDDKVSKDSVGIGLGLMICKQILRRVGPENMNTLFVESARDQGSSFYFFIQTLPPQQEKLFREKIRFERSSNTINTVRRSQSSELYKPSLEDVSPNKIMMFIPQISKKNTNVIKNDFINEQLNLDQPIENSIIETTQCLCESVLIVDDEFFNIQVLQYYLKQLGYPSESAINGKEALTKYEEKMRCRSPNCRAYKCVLMDVNMPVMNGWDAVRKIRLIEESCEPLILSRVPIIAVTAFGDPEDKKKCLLAGFDYVIVKPANLKLLQQAFQVLKIQV